jgi:hypothetical protein
MASDDTDFKKTAVRNAGRFAEGATAARHMPRQYGLATGKYLSRSTRAGIVDKATGKWLIRLDNAHKVGKGITPHININRRLTRVMDPHFPIPGFVVKGGEMATKTLSVVGKAAFVAGVVVDTYRIGEAFYNDYTKTKRPGKRTAKAAVSVAGGWAGGCAGAAAGSSTGAYIGGAIGALFGGVGAVPGAAVGSLFGAVLGGVGGGVGGSIGAEALVEGLVSSD